MNSIEQVLSAYNSKLSDNSKKELEKIFTLTHYKGGKIITGSNQKEIYIYFLKEGIICSYLVDKNGKNYIRSLFTPISVIASLKSNMNQSNVDVDYYSLSKSIVLKAKYNDFVELTNKHHDISILFSEICLHEYSKLINRVTQLTTLDATERYLTLKKMAPNIENEIPLYQIASYLNITPIQLSRIRKKITYN